MSSISGSRRCQIICLGPGIGRDLAGRRELVGDVTKLAVQALGRSTEHVNACPAVSLSRSIRRPFAWSITSRVVTASVSWLTRGVRLGRHGREAKQDAQMCGEQNGGVRVLAGEGVRLHAVVVERAGLAPVGRSFDTGAEMTLRTLLAARTKLGHRWSLVRSTAMTSCIVWIA